jgi:D-alanine-D-alanine ligase
VALVFGGRSGEHPISCVTAGGVLAAIDRDRFDVVAVGITRDGAWTLVSDDPDAWVVGADGTFPEVRDTGTQVLLPARAGSRELRLIRDGALTSGGPVDVVFPLLHGSWGEDGTIQGALELIDLPYVGSGVLASATAMDKAATKLRLLAAGVGVVPFVEVDARMWHPTPRAVDDVGTRLGWPVFVKPSRAGSSLGISRVPGPEGLAAAVAEAGRYDPHVLIEPEVRGREIECAVIGGRGGARGRAALPGEPVVLGGHEFYDYAAKYTDADGVALECPARLPERVTEAVRRVAVQAFEALGCEGLARVDFFYCPQGGEGPGLGEQGEREQVQGEQGGGERVQGEQAPAGEAPVEGAPPPELLVNEVNTMPGLTQFSLYPRMWEAVGMSYAAMVAELIELALARPVGLR